MVASGTQNSPCTCSCFIDYDLEYFTSDTEARGKHHKIHYEIQLDEFRRHLRRILTQLLGLWAPRPI